MIDDNSAKNKWITTERASIGGYPLVFCTICGALPVLANRGVFRWAARAALCGDGG